MGPTVLWSKWLLALSVENDSMGITWMFTGPSGAGATLGQVISFKLSAGQQHHLVASSRGSVTQACPTLPPYRHPCPWDSPCKNTGVGCHSLLSRILPPQGWDLGLPHCRQIYRLSHQARRWNWEKLTAAPPFRKRNRACLVPSSQLALTPLSIQADSCRTAASVFW